MKDTHTHEYSLTAGETDAQGLMPMSLIVARAIEVATEHANSLGIGFAALQEHGIAWVLTRVSVEMERYPRINEQYSLTTWIEGINRLYSDRCFVVHDGEGRVAGHIRSMWMAIDVRRRSAADLSVLPLEELPLGARECPIPKPRKLPPFTAQRETEYTFRYSDIDFNRHVNTVQYIRILLNQWPMSYHDTHRIAHFDMAFHQECHYGDTVSIHIADQTADSGTENPLDESRCEILKGDGSRAVAALVRFRG